MTEVPTLVVGAAGHRILADVADVRNGVERAIHRIEEHRPGRAMTVMSPLAEGADRLIAEAILARGDSRLAVVLPLPPKDYVADFASPQSVEEFERLLSLAAEVVVMAPRASRDEAYEAAADYILDHCELLVAIWDGRDAHGRGGTADTVARAREMGLPIAWVKAGNRKPGTMQPTTLGEAQGSVAFENFRLR